MKKRKNHSPDFKAKVALEAIREEMTLADKRTKRIIEYLSEEHNFGVIEV